MGRPKIVIDENLVYELAKIHCTNDEIAAVVKCHKDTLEKRFSALIKKGKEEGKSSLRRQMFAKAMDGNITMMIWLSKQHLGMSDKIADLAEKVEDKTINLKYRIGDKPQEPKTTEVVDASQTQHANTQ